MEIKLNIGDPKSGKTVKLVLPEEETKGLMGKRIGASIHGELIGYAGYEFTITGGSDFCGFPMRSDVQGIARKRIFIGPSVGNRRNERKGLRLRRNVAGNTVYSKTAQVNLKVLKHGSKPLFKEDKKEESAPKAEE